MHERSTPHHVETDRENPTGEGREDAVFEPRPQQRSLVKVATFHPRDTDLNFQHGDDTER